MAGDGAPETLEYTPTWVIAAVCAVIIVISLAMERSLHHLGKILKKKNQDPLFRALEKLKEELMLLGFISLLLTVFQNRISSICVSKDFVSHMLPCKLESSTKEHENYHDTDFYYGHVGNKRRLLSSGASSNFCTSKGKVPLVSLEALHQLHIFIFVLAVVHVVFSASTMVLGGAKIREWKHWEDAIQNECNSNIQTDRSHQNQFVTGRISGTWRKFAVINWMASFLKQFYGSVTKSDYKVLRAGFVKRHCAWNKNFNFHKYMMRALEDDFKKVVGISWYLWLFVILFLLLNVHGWHIYFWLSFLPLVLLLVVGTKLEYIITKLALHLEEELKDPEKEAHIKPSDEHFWFNEPGIVLYMIQFILFQNSFEIAFFFWILSTYGFKSCIMESIGYLIPRLIIGVIIQVLCSYSTLPLYAIVTQMGDMFKKAIFDEHLQDALMAWVGGAKERAEGAQQSVEVA
ncbi:MLO-like protein [Canna indica]|uniref:MLO-like protein n=1 Tax=Canna indica TaxID=4628 RepID=A0AAQ3QSS8_9LILI|nr:MLO-like protein [Canna indica]